MINIIKAAKKVKYINTGHDFTALIVYCIYIVAAFFTILYGFPNTIPAFSYHDGINVKLTNQYVVILETQTNREIKVHSTIRDLDYAFQTYSSISGLSVQVQ